MVSDFNCTQSIINYCEVFYGRIMTYRERAEWHQVQAATRKDDRILTSLMIERINQFSYPPSWPYSIFRSGNPERQSFQPFVRFQCRFQGHLSKINHKFEVAK